MNVKLNSKQFAIYNGLSNIGEEIAAFYLDGLSILKNDSIKTKSNLLGHIAREIDGGLRDILSTKEDKKTREVELKNIDLGEYSECKGHIASILSSINLEFNTDFAKKWVAVAVKFVNYAHRHGAYKEPREASLVISLWNEYEDVLLQLIGSHLNFISRIDRILKYNKPTDDQIEFINNAIKNPAFEYYFFKHLKSISWFIPLKEKGYFAADKNPIPEPAKPIPHWNVLEYLERVSQQVNAPENNKYIIDLLDILRDVTLNSDPDNYRTWFYFTKILCNIPDEYISVDDIRFFIPRWLSSTYDSSLPAGEISRRLLPKFNNEKDYDKAIAVIDCITDVKKHNENKKRKHHSSEEVYTSLIDSYWLNEAFETNFDLIKRICSIDLVYNLKDKIEKLLKKEKHDRIFENDKGNIIFQISEDDETEVYNIHIVRFDSNQDKHPCLDETISIKSSSSLHEFVETIINNFLQDKLADNLLDFDNNKKALTAFVNYLYFGLYDNWTYESFLNISDLHSNETLGIYHNIFDILVSTIIGKNSEDSNKIITCLLDSKYLYFKKFAFYIIGRYYSSLKDLFWEYIKRDEYNYFLQTLFFGDEIRVILEQTSELPQELVDVIERKINYEAAVLQSLKDVDLFIKSWKQRHYKALSKIQYFNELHQLLKHETQSDAELGPALIVGETRMGTGASPIYAADFNKMNNTEISEYLANFKGGNTWDGPSEESLANELRKFVKHNPSKITDDIIPFMNTAYKYVYEILWGFVDLWKDNQNINWLIIFNFIKAYIDRDDFWNDKLDMKGEHFKANHKWVINSIAELIEAGVKRDETSFPSELNPLVIEIFEIIIDNLSVDEKTNYDDPVGSALNSSHGRLITSLILFALREARLKNNAQYQDHWASKTKLLLQSPLNKRIGDSFTLIGQYLPQINYIDPDWSVDITNKMFDETFEYWRLFMTGYFYTNTVYDKIFIMMIHHYNKYFDNPFGNDTIKKIFINHIGLSYLRELESKKNSLFESVLQRWGAVDILNLINYFWHQYDGLKNNESDNIDIKQKKNQTITKIINFWKKVYCFYKEKNPDDYSEYDKKILSSVSNLARYLHEINDENYLWIMQTIPYLPDDYNISYMIEYLNNLKDKGEGRIKTANFVCDIYLSILKYSTPDFDKDHIRETIKYLYELSRIEKDNVLKEKIDIISNTYGKNGVMDDKGHLFLRDLYEEYN